MAYLFDRVAAAVFLALCLLASPLAVAGGDPQSLRYLSFAIRDIPPSRAESEAWAAGGQSLTDFANAWLASPEHEARVGRFIGDLLGVSNGIQVGRSHLILSAGASGALRLPTKDDCAIEDAVSVSAWWLADGETAKVCPNTVSNAYVFGTGKSKIRCVSAGMKGINDPRCGCGPEMMLCLPSTVVPKVRLAVIEELPRRAKEAYAKDWSWIDLFGGPTYFGDRFGYWRYFFSQFAFRDGEPTAADFAAWKSLPLEGNASAAFPGGEARAGIITSPGFLSQNNNFRARTRALVESLLCQTINATLNTAGYTDFVNPDLSKNDIKHAARSDCAACHLFLDNIGPALFNFDGDGVVRATAAKSTASRAFGESGAGPTFIAHALIELGPGFGACMTKRVWEGFAGTPFDEVAEADRAAFVAEAGSPRRLIQAVLRSNLFQAGRTPTPLPGAEPEPAAPTRSFADVAPIIAGHCGDARCHGAGSGVAVYVDQPANVDAAAKRMLARIQLNGAGQMPPADAGRALSDADRATLAAYLQAAP